MHEIFFEQYSDEKFCLEAVKSDGDALQYVKGADCGNLS